MAPLPGPRGAIEVTRGAWGYPTIHARDADDGAWALGWMHATDRLLQTQLSRVLAEGRLQEVVGDKPFARTADRAIRSLGFGRDLEADLARATPGLRARLDAYTAGFDAGTRARGWPWLLRALGVAPRPWTPVDVLRTYKALAWFGLTSTAQLAKAVVAEMIANGADPDAVRALLGPGGEGLDLEAARAVDWHADDALLGVPVLGGSNAFGVAGRRSASGGAILLAEFHLRIGELPPMLYAADVRYPDGRYTLGVTVPGQPSFLAGRNHRAGWSYTFGHADNIDVTVERVEGDSVVVGGRREPLTRRVETVRVGRRRTETWTFRDLPGGGGVLGQGDGRHPAVRWRGLEGALGDLEVLAAVPDQGSVDALVALHRQVRVLSTAAVFGDADGHVAWMHTGVVAARRAGWGPRVRGEDDPDLPESARPVVVDPPAGVVAAANEASAGWTSFPEPRYRKQRLLQRLAARDVWDEAGAEQVTVDEVDLCAERLVRVWARWLPDDAGLAALVAWAGDQEAVAVEVARAHRARFHRWHHEACEGLLAWLVGAPAAARLLHDLGLHLVLHEGLDDLLADERPDVLDPDVLHRVVRDAWRASAEPGASAMPTQVRFVHPVEQGVLPAWLGLSSRPLPVAGGPTSLCQLRTMPLLGETMLGGPAFRLVMDLGRPGARFAMAGGASERPRGPGYGEGLDAWSEGRYADLGPRDVSARDRAG